MLHDIATEQFGGDGWRAMVDLRHRVLRAPLGLAFTEDQLAAEADQIHLALRLRARPGRLIGTLLLQPLTSTTAKLRQMAIDPDFAGLGLGSALLAHAETTAHALDVHEILLSARETAVGFYRRNGYRSEGDPTIEVTLPHRLMRKRLGVIPRPAA